MNLEDHAGDVLRKARLMAAVSLEAAARAAGLSVDEMSALEASGVCAQRPDFAAVAAVLGLQAAKLAALLHGWRPEPVDLARWRELRQFSTTAGGNTVHCYLAWDEVTREAAMFDTGWDPAPVFATVESEHLQLKHFFITHSHHDHIAGLEAVRAKFPKIFIHTDMRGALPQHKNRRNDCIHLGSLRVTNRETPGHAADGVTYLVGNWPEDAPHVAIVGDAIFAGSMGGAPEHGALAKAAVRDQILTLPADTLLCSGHGPLTTVGWEQQNNPFF